MTTLQPDEKRQKVLDLRAEVLSYGQIAERLGIAKPSVVYYVKHPKPTGQPRPNVSQQSARNLELTAENARLRQLAAFLCGGIQGLASSREVPAERIEPFLQAYNSIIPPSDR